MNGFVFFLAGVFFVGQQSSERFEVKEDSSLKTQYVADGNAVQFECFAPIGACVGEVQGNLTTDEQNVLPSLSLYANRRMELVATQPQLANIQHMLGETKKVTMQITKHVENGGIFFRVKTHYRFTSGARASLPHFSKGELWQYDNDQKKLVLVEEASNFHVLY